MNNKETKPEWCINCEFVAKKFKNMSLYIVTDFKTFETEYSGRETVPMLYCSKSKKYIEIGDNPPKWCPL